FLLITLGVLVVIGALYYLAKGLRIQRALVKLPIEANNDPETSGDARDFAATSEATQDYRSAIRYLYLSSLLLLDERGLIHYDRTLTNREHLRQVANLPHLVEALRPVVNTFDRVWYGFEPVDETMYQEFRQNVDRLHQMTPIEL